MKNANNVTQQTIVPNGQKPVCINFISEINPLTASTLSGAFAKVVDDGHDEIHLFHSTPGGTVADGIAIYRASCKSPNWVKFSRV